MGPRLGTRALLTYAVLLCAIGSLALGFLSMAASAKPSPETWSGTVRLTDSYFVEPGETLNISPGTVVDPAPESTNVSIFVSGTMHALGTQEKPVTISVPIIAQAEHSRPSVLRDVRLEEAGGHELCQLRIERGHLQIHDSHLEGSKIGVCLSGTDSSGTVNRTTIQAHDTGIRLARNASLTAGNSTFVGNRVGIDILLSPKENGSLPEGEIRLVNNTYERHVDTSSKADPGTYFRPSQAMGLRVQTTSPLAFNPTLEERFQAWQTWHWAVLSVGDRFRNNTLGVYLGPGVAAVGLHETEFEANDVGIRNAAEPDDARARLNAHIYAARFDNDARDIYSEGEHHDLFWTKSSIRAACLLEESRPPNAVCEDETTAFLEDLGLFASLIAVIVGAVAWLTELGSYAIIRALPLARLFNRIENDDLLESDARLDLLDIIEEEPGLHLRELARRVGGYGATAYHLNRLEDANLISSETDGIYRRFYLSWTEGPEAPRLTTRKKVLKAVEQDPGIHASEIARKLGKSRQVVHYHTTVLREQGRIEAVEHGRRKELFPKLDG